MKNLITMLLLVTTIAVTAQTTIDLSAMTEDITLGDNCSSTQEQPVFITTGDVNLNGFEINLRNANLDIMGNLNGGGEINGCGQSAIYVQGVIQNDPDIDDDVEITGDPLRVEQYLLPRVHYVYNRDTKELNLTEEQQVVIYNLLGQVLIDEFTDVVDLSQTSEVVVIVRTKDGSMKLLR